MKVILTRRNSPFFAQGEFDLSTRSLVVLKGSTVSHDIHYTNTFRGAGTIEKYRKKYVVDGVTTEDVTFKSPSTAANFVTGRSTNGLVAWKTVDGQTIKMLIDSLNKSPCNEEGIF